MTWVWTKLTEQLYPDRKAGTEVPKGYLREGWDGQGFPDRAWVKKGYVEKWATCPVCKSHDCWVDPKDDHFTCYRGCGFSTRERVGDTL